VIVAATEDSWEHTIVPRLMAAQADLTRVYRVDVVTAEGFEGRLTLPADIGGLAEQALGVDAAMILLDPLISRLAASLDSHKDGEVRQALEPLVAVADRCHSVVLGLIHTNKTGTADALTAIMGSRAFVAVARSVLFAMTDPYDEDRRLLGQPKNNLGRSDLPTLTYRIAGVMVAETAEGPVWTGRLEWTEDTDLTINDALEAIAQGARKGATKDAAEWLAGYLESQGAGVNSKTVEAAAKTAGHAWRTVQRAAEKLNVDQQSSGFPRSTYWFLTSPEPVREERF
jgi:hypothetical protein